MSEFSELAKGEARRLSYTEIDAEQMAVRRAEIAGQVIEDELEEPRLDELCSVLGLETDELDNPAVRFTAKDIALAAWSNWGAGSFDRAHPRSSLEPGEFIVLNDYFSEIVTLGEDS